MAVGPERTQSSVVAADRPAKSDGANRFRPGVKALVMDAEHVLLVEETHADGEAFWTLPGGGLLPGETTRQALRREISEELRAELVLGDAVGCLTYRHRSTPGLVTVYIVYEGALLGSPDPNPSEGINGYRWARPDSPPDGLLPAFEAGLDALVEPTAADTTSEATCSPAETEQ